jgi:hypothetical protein
MALELSASLVCSSPKERGKEGQRQESCTGIKHMRESGQDHDWFVAYGEGSCREGELQRKNVAWI